MSLFKPLDVVIRNGRVMDPETGYDESGVDVGIAEGKIAAIGKLGNTKGKVEIDAKGMVVCPGFIEAHMHGTDQFTLKAAIRDGLTTAMDFEAGIRDTAAWYAEAEGKTQPNYGHVACAAYARVAVLDGQDLAAIAKDVTYLFSRVVSAVGKRAKEEGRPMGWNAAIPDKLQMTQIMEVLDEELRQGALGVGCPVGYMTHGITAYEMFKYQELASKYGRLTNAHTRFAGVLPPTSGALGIQEIMSNAMALNAPVMVAHCNSVMDWEFTQDYVNLARRNGHKIMGESYPYHAGNTLASTDVIKKESMESMGITYNDIYFLDSGERWTEEIWSKRMDNPGRSIVVEMNKESDIRKWMKDPETIVCSDGMPVVDPSTGDVLPFEHPVEGITCHPRVAGSRGKFLRMLREELKDDLTLMQGLAKMTYLPAKYFCELAGIPHFRFKGRMQEGCDADIVIFDPDTVTDNATFKDGEGMLPTTGMPYVLVNGVPVVVDSVLQKVFPGKPIRFPVQPKGRISEIVVDPPYRPGMGENKRHIEHFGNGCC